MQNKDKEEAIVTAYKYIEILYSAIGNIVLDIREQKNEIKLNKMLEIVDGLRWLVDIVYLTRDIQVEIVEIKDIKEALSEGINALEEKDFVLLADIFEYEIMEILQQWYERLAITVEEI